MPSGAESESYKDTTAADEFGTTARLCQANLSRRVFLATALAGSASWLALPSNGAATREQAASRGGPVSRTQGGELIDLSIRDASQLVRQKKVSPVELTHASLAQIEKLNPALNAFITVTAESAAKDSRAA